MIEPRSSLRRSIVWDEDDRITSISDNGRTTDFVYDDAGQRTIKRGPRGETVYAFPTWVVRSGTIGTSHVFVGSTRVASHVWPGRSHLEPPGDDALGGMLGNWWEHRSDAGFAHARDTEMNPHYRVGSHTPMSGRPETQFLYFYHPDHLGSTEFVTDTDGELYEHAQYFPSGETWVRQGDNADRLPWLFTSQELDAETGLYYLNARYYDPRVGVFASTDPALSAEYLSSTGHEPGMRGVYDPRNLSSFCYSHNSPIVYSDPGGRCPPCVAVVIIIALASTPAIAGDVDPERRTHRPSDAALLAHTALRAVPVGGVIPGALAGAADTAIGDADRGEMSSPGTYALSTGAGAAGGLLGGRTPRPSGAPAVARETTETAGRTMGSEFVEAAGRACSGGACVCFAEGTSVLTPSGPAAIESIEVGDLVWSRDEVTGEVTAEHVVHTFVTSDRQVLDLEIETDAGEHDVLRVTPQHPFWTLDGTWTVAGDLEVGDRLVSFGGDLARVTDLRPESTRVTVFNFEVERTHTYFVGDIGIWVHNDCWDDIARHAIEGSGHLFRGGRDIAALGRYLRAWGASVGADSAENATRDIVSRRGREIFVRRAGGSGSWFEADSIAAAQRYVERLVSRGLTQL